MVKSKKSCPTNKVLNPKTNRCILKKSANKKSRKPYKKVSKKSCPTNKVLNPKTNRCILKKSANKKSRKPYKKVSRKSCPENKVLNPKTNRCILKKSAKKSRKSGNKKVESIYFTPQELNLMKVASRQPSSKFYSPKSKMSNKKCGVYFTA